MDKFHACKRLMQVAWTNFTRANGSCKLHGQISRVQTAHANCMGKFHACKRLMQVAWTNFTCANGSCKLHGQISRVQTAHASCMDKFHACKRLMQTAWTNFTRANGSCKLHGQISHVQTAHANCMGNFRAGKRLLQLAWTISALGNGCCNLHGQFPRGLALKIKPEKGAIIFPRYGTIGRNILIDFNKEFLVLYACTIIKNTTNLMSSECVLPYSLMFNRRTNPNRPRN
jgi:hypothetical protein